MPGPEFRFNLDDINVTQSALEGIWSFISVGLLRTRIDTSATVSPNTRIDERNSTVHITDRSLIKVIQSVDWTNFTNEKSGRNWKELSLSEFIGEGLHRDGTMLAEFFLSAFGLKNSDELGKQLIKKYALDRISSPKKLWKIVQTFIQKEATHKSVLKPELLDVLLIPKHSVPKTWAGLVEMLDILYIRDTHGLKITQFPESLESDIVQLLKNVVIPLSKIPLPFTTIMSIDNLQYPEGYFQPHTLNKWWIVNLSDLYETMGEAYNPLLSHYPVINSKKREPESIAFHYNDCVCVDLGYPELDDLSSI